MLGELRVENLLLIERAELHLGPGLNVLTGETGAGKSVLAHALDLLMGGRPKQGIVRPGASEAYVEGCFLLPRGVAKRLPEGCVVEGLEENACGSGTGDGRGGGDGSGERDDRDAGEGEALELVIARRVLSDGRTRAYLNGRSAAIGDLRRIAAELIAFHGQHEHRRLTDAAEQLAILDGFCGPEQQRRRRRCAAALAQVRRAKAELDRLAGLQRDRERELDLLQHELAEIERLDPKLGEHERLHSQRERLRQIDALRAAALLGAAELAGDEQELRGASSLIASASVRIDQMQGVDVDLDALGERCRALVLEAEDLAAELRRCGEGLDAEEGELEHLEERLAEIERLCRKHGGDLEAVLAYAQQGRRRCDELLGVETATSEATKRLQAAEGELDGHVRALRAARSKAAPKLEKEMEEQLASLAMKEARFRVDLSEREPTGSGGDAVEFVLAPNPGVAAGSLRETASGGELSRTMLALSAICDGQTVGVSLPSTLVFDEIDAGIGGHTARVVGERLRKLADGRQVLCITHLPQIASLAQRHFSIVKGSTGNSTSATVVQLSEQDVVGELVRMLGAAEDDVAATRHAEELLSAA